MKQNDKTIETEEIFHGGSGFNAAKSSFQVSGKEKELTSFDKDFPKKSEDNSLNTMESTQESYNFAKKSKDIDLSVSKFELENLEAYNVEELGGSVAPVADDL